MQMIKKLLITELYGCLVFNSANGVIDPWLISFWEKVLAFYPLPTGTRQLSDSEP